jgi:hypothetical protein
MAEWCEILEAHIDLLQLKIILDPLRLVQIANFEWIVLFPWSKGFIRMILLNYKLEFKCIDPITDTFVIMINLITIAKLEAELNFDTEAAFRK